MIGQKIKELREETGITQNMLADSLRVDRSTIAKYEGGYRTPDVYMLCSIADYFEVSLDYLAGRTNIR